MRMNDFRIVRNTLIKYTGKEDHIFVPEGVTAIGSQAFAYQQNLISVVLPEGVVTIAERAFDSCQNLRSVTIPSTVTKIENGAFYNCRTIDNIVIPQGVAYVAAKTFFGCRALKTVSLPDTVTTIGEEAFKRCTALEDMVIGDSVTAIGKEAFADCLSLVRVAIGKGVEILRWNTFYGCRKLEKVSLGEGLRLVEYGAFDTCPALSELFFHGDETAFNAITIKSLRNESLIGAVRHFDVKAPLIEPEHALVAPAVTPEQITFEVVEEIPLAVEEATEVKAQEMPTPQEVPAVKEEKALPDYDQIAMDLGELSFGKPKKEKRIKKALERRTQVRTSPKSTAEELTDTFKKDFYQRFISMIADDVVASEKARAASMTEDGFETQSEALFLVPAQEAYEFGCLCLFMERYNWAFRAFLSAAGKGNLPSQFYVGSCFLYGIDTTKKIVDAARWLTKCKNDATFGEEAKKLLAVVDEELEKPENAALKIKRGKK